MNIIDKEKSIMTESIDSILILSNFINYNNSTKLEKRNKKIKKELKKLKKLIKQDEFDKCMNEEWIDKYHEYW